MIEEISFSYRSQYPCKSVAKKQVGKLLDLYLPAADVNASVAITSMTGSDPAQKHPEARASYGPIMVHQRFSHALNALCLKISDFELHICFFPCGLKSSSNVFHGGIFLLRVRALIRPNDDRGYCEDTAQGRHEK